MQFFFFVTGFCHKYTFFYFWLIICPAIFPIYPFSFRIYRGVTPAGQHVMIENDDEGLEE